VCVCVSVFERKRAIECEDLNGVAKRKEEKKW